jgi:hypothetical protein
MVSVSWLCQAEIWPAHSKDTVDALIAQATLYHLPYYASFKRSFYKLTIFFVTQDDPSS